MTSASGRTPWSLLRAQWLDVPVGTDLRRPTLTWGAFSEGFEHCLDVVGSHVGERLRDRATVEVIVTEVVVENLHVLTSRLGDEEKLEQLLAAADRLIARSLAAST